MSVSKWAYDESRCEGSSCCGDCDLCSKADEITGYAGEEQEGQCDNLIQHVGYSPEQMGYDK